ncbi:helix-turn-helix transcriptional regulator [Leptospira sp. 201903074]|nr:helix-turn-helix transcriptional regulator [Leptospira abararensis]
MFVGQLPYLAFHSTVTSATVVGLTTEIKKRLKGNGQWMSSRCFVFDGTLSHETVLDGPVGILFADPGSEIGEILTKEAGPNGLSSNPTWAQELIATCFEIQSANPEQYPEILSSSFPFNQLTPAKKIQDDDRLINVIRILIESPEETLNVEDLASEIGMSESWLLHEFKNVVGLPIRAFRKWFRIKTAVIALKKGATLTDAALNAGFYDQAHFTNVFRDIFGIAPSVVFKKGEPIRWYIENEEIDKILKVF